MKTAAVPAFFGLAALYYARACTPSTQFTSLPFAPAVDKSPAHRTSLWTALRGP